MGVRASEFLRSDNGYFSETNVNSCVAAAIKPYRAAGREAHHLPVEQRWTSPPPLAADANAVDEMKHRMTTPEGRAVDAQRKSTVDLCTGSSNPCRVFASFTLRGLKNVSGQWTLVSIAWNLKRLSICPATNATAGLQRPETRP